MILQNNYYETQQDEDMEALEGNYRYSSEIELFSYTHCVYGVLRLL